MGAQGEFRSRSSESISIVDERHIAGFPIPRGVLEVVPERICVGLVLFELQGEEARKGNRVEVEGEVSRRCNTVT